VPLAFVPIAIVEGSGLRSGS
jgi:hypothetical protein